MRGKILTLPEIQPPVVDLARYRQQLLRLDPVKQNGRVTQVIGLVIESVGPNAMVGEICNIYYDRANYYDPTTTMKLLDQLPAVLHQAGVLRVMDIVGSLTSLNRQP